MKLKQHLNKERGRASALASALGVSAATISEWAAGTKQVPAIRCPDIERETSGAVTCEDLRPDLAEQWAYLRGTKKRAA